MRGCSPSSGSSITITAGLYLLGWRNNVARAMNRRVPSERADAPKYWSDSLCFQASRIVPSFKGSGRKKKSSKNKETTPVDSEAEEEQPKKHKTKKSKEVKFDDEVDVDDDDISVKKKKKNIEKKKKKRNE